MPGERQVGVRVGDEEDPPRYEINKAGGTWSGLSGSARDVIQARDVSGGVHFHTPDVGRQPALYQLPGDVRGFVGRDPDLEFLDSILDRHGELSETVVISTISGTAGVGKTSLAVHWAHRVKNRFPDGQLHINLRGYDPGPPVTADQALERFLRALGIAPGAIPEETEARSALFRSLLSGRRMLLVLDNAATVGQVRPLLPGSASCMVVVTSRDRLSGLVARDGAHRLNLDVLSEEEAVTLIRDATADHRGPDSPESLAELARLCARLPLALRIAAERAAARPRMPLDELIAELKDESLLWDALSADEEEADAVHTVFAWSYRALTQDAARLFRLLGLHPGQDFSLLAAAALADLGAGRVRRLLDALVGAHLLDETSYDRYQFHDLLRAYAHGQAVRNDHSEDLRSATERLCRWYLEAMATVADVHDIFYADDWAVARPPEDRTGLPSFADYEKAMIWFAAETDNLIAICRLAGEAELDEIAWKLPALLRTPYLDRYPVQGWLPLAETALRAARRSGDRRGESISLMGFAIAYREEQRIAEAIEASQAALAAAEAIGDRYQRVAVFVMMGHAQRRGRDFDAALDSYEQALAIAEEGELFLWTVWATIGMAEALLDAGRLTEARERITGIMTAMPPGENLGARSECLWVLAWIERELGALAEADGHIHDVLAIAYETKNTMYQGRGELELGRLLLDTGRFEEALTPLQHAVAISRRLGDRTSEANALDETGRAYRELNRPADALNFHQLASTMHRDLDDRWRLACALHNLGLTLDRLGDRETAVGHWREAVALIEDYRDLRAATLRSLIEAALGGHESDR